MITFIPQALTGPVWKLITLPDGGTFEIAVRRPTLDQLLTALEEISNETNRVFQLRARLVDWRGVNDESGQPVPYSWGALSQLSLSYPDVIWDILIAVNEAIEATNLKNLPTPPASGGTETTGETAVSTPSSVPTGTSGESAGSAVSSE